MLCNVNKPLYMSNMRTAAVTPPKPVIADRWVTESHSAFSYYVPVLTGGIKAKHARPVSGASSRTHASAGPVPSTDHAPPFAPADNGDSGSHASDDSEPIETAEDGVQTDAVVTGQKGIAERSAEAAARQAARDRAQRERMQAANSRQLANSAFPRLFHRPAFAPELGTGNKTPLNERDYLASFNIQPLLHPATDKGQALLRAPRHLVASTAVLHAHGRYDAEKFLPGSGSAAAAGASAAASPVRTPGRPGSARKLMIQEAERMLQKEGELACM